MNGQLFEGFDRLAEVYLYGNECINQSFYEINEIAMMPEVLDEKCGFVEEEETD